MTVLHVNEGRHCENLTETINMDTWLQANLPAFEETFSTQAADWAYLELGELVFARKLLWIRGLFWILCKGSL